MAEGEAPSLQERGVVGLHLVDPASFLRETAPSHLNVADLKRGCLIPHRSGTTALGGDFSEEEDDAACDCFNRTRKKEKKKKRKRNKRKHIDIAAHHGT